MLLNDKEFQRYVTSTYPNITDRVLDREHIAGHCPKCNRTIGLQVVETHAVAHATRYDDLKVILGIPYSVVLGCPVCHSRAVWVLYRIDDPGGDGPLVENALQTRHPQQKVQVYRIAALPPEGQHDIPDLPEEPRALRAAYSEAIRCLDNNCPMAAAAMFRRALQIITRDILGAKHSSLATELESLVGKSNKLGVTLTKSFEKNGYIVREVGNQAAHPDRDPDLLSFNNDDAQNLYELFLAIVAELFVAPLAAKRATEALMTRRKLTVSQ